LASDALRAFIADQLFAKPGEMRTSWSRFVLSLLLRYPESLEEMKRQLRDNVEKVYAQTRKETEPPTFAEYETAHGIDELTRLHGKLLMDLMKDSRIGRLIFGMRWGIIKFSRAGHGLLTSDRPVTTNAFRISANHLCLPIGPERMFFACETEKAELEFQKLDPNAVMRGMNNATAKRAVKYVYGKDDRQLRFIENRLRPRS
jgi:hypothetical protein